MIVTFNGATLGFVRSSKGNGPIVLRSPDPIETDNGEGEERVKLHEADGIYSLKLTPPQSAAFDAILADIPAFAAMLSPDPETGLSSVTLPDARKGRHVVAGASLLDTLRAAQEAAQDAPTNAPDAPKSRKGRKAQG